MGFFSNLFENDTEEQIKEKSSVKNSITGKVVEGSLKAVRTVYNKKVAFINSISDIEPDWFFCAEEVVSSQHSKLCKEYENLQEQKSKIKDEIVNAQKEKDSYTKILQQDDLDSDTKKRMYDKNLEITQVIEQLTNEFEQSELCIKNKADEIIKNLSLVEKNLVECEKCVRQYNVESLFVKYELPLVESLFVKLEDIKHGNYESVPEKLESYLAKIDEADIFHPIVCFFRGKQLVSEGQYGRAIPLIHKTILWCPDCVEYHEVLLEAYNGIGNETAVKVEKDIIEMLR